MKPIQIIYNPKGNTLYVRLSHKKEKYCTEENLGKEVIFSRANDGTVVGFEILNVLSPRVRKKHLNPFETEVLSVR